MLTITDVIERPKTHLFVITDSSGQKHATRNMFLASLADQYRKAKTPVRIDSFSGWWYRDLQDIRSEAEVTA